MKTFGDEKWNNPWFRFELFWDEKWSNLWIHPNRHPSRHPSSHPSKQSVLEEFLDLGISISSSSLLLRGFQCSWGISWFGNFDLLLIAVVAQIPMFLRIFLIWEFRSPPPRCCYGFDSFVCHGEAEVDPSVMPL